MSLLWACLMLGVCIEMVALPYFKRFWLLLGVALWLTSYSDGFFWVPVDRSALDETN